MKLKVQKIPWYRTWKGLLGTERAKVILLKTRFGIHTFGLKYPIDVVILDKNGIVKKLKEHLLPNRIFVWNPKFDTVLELPIGTIRKMKITLGCLWPI